MHNDHDIVFPLKKAEVKPQKAPYAPKGALFWIVIAALLQTQIFTHLWHWTGLV